MFYSPKFIDLHKLTAEICMATTKIDLTKEIVFASSDSNLSHQIAQAEKKGLLRKIAPRIYTSNTIDSVENIVRRNIIDILAWRYPSAVISHRSANELRPTKEGEFFLTTTHNKRITDLSGITLNLLKGKPAIEGDIPYNGLYIAGEYRWLLENMQSSRKQGDFSKILPVSAIEDKLEKIFLLGGENKLNEYRDKLRETASILEMPTEFERINKIISALLSTHSSDVLSTSSAKAIATGMPFDKNRGELFERLFESIKDRFFVERTNRNRDEESFRLFSFFESYFSNYIEGTRFEVDEAKQIVDTGIPIPRRDKDSHDIIGTFRLLSNRVEMQRIPTTAEELFAILQYRHSILLAGRPECNPGIFKNINNRAGNTEFVDHQLVKGTLHYGFKYYTALKEPFARAIYMMFMISETHPFIDGNGRVSRIMMNAELVRGDQTRIIVPIVFREDYILALRKLTRRQDPQAYIRVMEKLQLFSDNLYGTDFTELKEYLAQCNAYEEPSQAKLEIIDRTFEQF